MLKTIFWSIGLAAAGFVALCALLYLRQRGMLYYPTPPVRTGEAQPLYLENGGERLQVWQVVRGGEKALIYFGGNAEDVALNLPQFKRLFPSYSLYLMNYRGYGGSSGSPSEEGLFSDSLALFDHVQKSHTDISVMGRSLGTGIATYLAAERPVRRLVLVTPFDTMVRLAKTYYPFVPVDLLLKDRYDSLGRAAELNGEILAVIAEHDEVIPRSRSETLAEALPDGSSRVEIVPGSGHNTIGSFPQYEKLLQDFLDPASAP